MRVHRNDHKAARPLVARQSEAPIATVDLAQVLLDGERRVQRIILTRRSDLFAAAVLAEQGLRETQGMHPAHFESIDDRRTWSWVQGSLTNASRQARAYQELAHELDVYHATYARFVQLQNAVGGDAERFPRKYQEAVERASTRSAMALCLGALAAGALLVALGRAHALPTVLGALLFCVSMVGAMQWRERAKRLAVARRVLAVARRQAKACKDFMRDPQGGEWLYATWGRHPLVVQEPGPSAQLLGSGTYRNARLPAEMVG